MQRADHDKCPTDEPLPCRVRRLAGYSVDARYLAFVLLGTMIITIITLVTCKELIMQRALTIRIMKVFPGFLSAREWENNHWD